jgi:hypothetical protein
VREAQAAAALDHPNICTIYEVGEGDGHSYIATHTSMGSSRRPDIRRFPADDRLGFEAWATLPGAEAVEHDDFVPSTDCATFVFTLSDELRNPFRIPLAGR